MSSDPATSSDHHSLKTILSKMPDKSRSSAGALVLRLAFQLPVRTRRHVLFFLYHHRFANFRHPQTFSEKMNWRILNDRRELLAWTCDKLETKEHASAAGVATAETLWSGAEVSTLVGVGLPDRWVLKPNHRSGAVYFGSGPVVDANSLPPSHEDWLADAQSAERGEWAYSRARKLLFVEQMLGEEPPVDFKFFVFDGRVKFVQIDTDRFSGHRRRFYSPSWEPMPFSSPYPIAEPMPAPTRLDEMVLAAEHMASGFDFLRVDLYFVDDTVYLGEVTPYAGGGLEPFSPRVADRSIGELWTLPDVSERS
jgi:hypothetical protein